MAQMTFDASSISPADPLEPLPAGKYPAQVVQSEMRPTKAGDGQYLWLEFDVLDGPYKGRKIWERLNLVNANPQTTEIAQRQLAALCRAVGQMQVTDSEQLHHRSMTVNVKYRPAGPDKSGVHREARNEIGGYEPADQRPAASPPASPRAAAGTTPPWRRSA